MRFGAGHARTEHLLRGLGRRQHRLESAFDHGRGLAFDIRAGHVAPVSGAVAAREDVGDDRFVGPDGAAADIVRFGALRAVGEDGAGRGIAHAFEFGFELRPQKFAGQDLAAVFQITPGVDFRIDEDLPELAHDLLGRLLGFEDGVLFGGGFDLAAGVERPFGGDGPDTGAGKFFRLAEREGVGNDPMVDPEFAAEVDRDGIGRIFPVDELRVFDDLDARFDFGGGAGVFERGDDEIFFRIGFEIDHGIGRIEAAGVEQVGGLFGRGDDEFRRRFRFRT